MKILNVLLGIVTVFIFLMSLSGWVTVSPPASVLTTAFRMPYQMIAKHLVIVLMLCMTGYYTFILIKGISPSPFSVGCSIVLLVCALMGAVFCVRISTAETLISGDNYDYIAESNLSFRTTVEDLHMESEMNQLMVYTPADSEKQKTCIVHLNYGGYALQDIEMRDWLQKLCTQQGYSYAQLGGIGSEDGNFIEIVKDIKRGLAFLQEEKGYDSFILAGGSSGGTFALTIAFSGTNPEIYGEDNVQVNGVIALYPMIDAALNYEYFVTSNTGTNGVFDFMGDAMYCWLYNGETGTLSGESKKLMDKVFGERENPDNVIYDLSNVNQLIGNQNIPVLIIQGALDSMLPIEDKRELFQDWSNQGKSIAYLELHGLDHAFDLMEMSVQNKRVNKEISSWLYQFAQ